MKEASGDLSMTAVAVVAIVAVGALFTTLIYPNIKASLERKSLCSGAYSCTKCSSGSMTCTVQEVGKTNATTGYVCPCND